MARPNQNFKLLNNGLSSINENGETPIKISAWNTVSPGHIHHVGFEVLTAVVMKSSILWDITPCIPLKVNRRLEE
jgi:hypothetical protein